ncbi:lipopolysaccharide transport periplasmic protein LptA [Candidatus Methylobacter oryzae]|uniref:Lipopolysaccharide export system protein LptA n=1 Tax=Candidatus Methylobacter oryzae TaxID=2497749 RepID=A0ABY3C6V7_9GAMM|nr:lipopolysaccharide transport periplasmic protein LptA [Candidatus Methylobacter oryzae]TRW91296.1 lipopolysaccharide transport periplasmic protein LptA [Candidatus Methylobacter oryzae]
MKQNKNLGCRILRRSSCCLLLLALFSTSVCALESDGDQPIIIDSNTATYDDVKAISTYTGNVISIQGSIRVNSDKLVVYFIDGEADKMVFTGNLAKFKQTPHEGDPDITGEALTGEYYPKKNLLVLIGKATVWQGSGAYASDFIEYDLKTSLVKAGEKESDNKRVHVVLQPKGKEQAQGQEKKTTVKDNNK